MGNIFDTERYYDDRESFNKAVLKQHNNVYRGLNDVYLPPYQETRVLRDLPREAAMISEAPTHLELINSNNETVVYAINKIRSNPNSNTDYICVKPVPGKPKELDINLTKFSPTSPMIQAGGRKDDDEDSEDFRVGIIESDDDLTSEDLRNMQARIFKSLSDDEYDDIDIRKIDEDSLDREVAHIMDGFKQSRQKRSMLDTEDHTILKTRNRKYR